MTLEMDVKRLEMSICESMTKANVEILMMVYYLSIQKIIIDYKNGNTCKILLIIAVR